MPLMKPATLTGNFELEIFLVGYFAASGYIGKIKQKVAQAGKSRITRNFEPKTLNLQIILNGNHGIQFIPDRE